MKNVVSFDDLYLIPGYSNIATRHSIDLTPNVPKILEDVFKNPLIAAPMDTVVNAEVAEVLRKSGGTAVLHRYMSIEDQVKEFKKIVWSHLEKPGIFCAVGAVGDYFERFQALYNAGCRFICIDVAHGHHQNVANAMNRILSDKDDVIIMAGNVADIDGYEFLVDNGATFVRCGVAAGKVCVTKNKTGFGMPTLETIIRCARSNRNGLIVADGGIRDSGDIVKALACGADFVMMGSMLSGHVESPGEVISNGKEHFKVYRGMASASAQKDWRGRVSVTEGIETLVPLKDCSLEETVQSILGGIKSGVSYAGSSNLKEFYANVKRQFV